MAKMKLVTKAIEKTLPAIGSTSEKDNTQIAVPLKLFNPTGSGTWYITEYDPATGEAFGYVTGMGGDELGYISIPELASVTLHWGLGIERDLHWDPKTTLADVMNGKRS